MAKIGVITFSDTTDNYGQVLQYLAIHEYLKQRGHKPFLLRYKSKKSPLWRRVVSYIYHYIFSVPKPAPEKSELTKLYDQWTEWSEKNNVLHPRYFEEFRANSFDIQTIVGLNDKSIQKFDAFAIGSDQIWSYVKSWNFLGFVPDDKIKFTIAPSTGNKQFTCDQIKQASEMLHRFSFVTCREDSGIAFCKDAGFENAVKILDPTFLIDKTSYGHYVQKELKVDTPYIFVYMLGAECDVNMVDISKFAQKHSLGVKYVASQGREDSCKKIWATVPEWISLMKGASYVITNSYHGMALSIIFQKQFLVLPVTGITSFMNERILSLADLFNLNNRIYKNSFDKIFDPIDYNLSNGIIAKNKDILDKKMLEINY